MYIAELSELSDLGSDLIAEIKSIRFSLPLERLIKASAFVADKNNGLGGILERITSVQLNAE